MSLADAAKAAGLLFAAALIQVTLLSPVEILRGTPDLLLVTLVGVSLLRGSIYGAAGGFFAGLVIDTTTLETLGLSSLLLTVAGYWIGRYGETTGRDRLHAPFLSVAVVTVLYLAGSLVLHFMLGESASARIFFAALVPSVAMNVLLTAPVYALCSRVLRQPERRELAREVRLLG